MGGNEILRFYNNDACFAFAVDFFPARPGVGFRILQRILGSFLSHVDREISAQNLCAALHQIFRSIKILCASMYQRITKAKQVLLCSEDLL